MCYSADVLYMQIPEKYVHEILNVKDSNSNIIKTVVFKMSIFNIDVNWIARAFVMSNSKTMFIEPFMKGPTSLANILNTT